VSSGENRRYQGKFPLIEPEEIVKIHYPREIQKHTESRASLYDDSTWAFAGREGFVGMVVSTSRAI